MFHAIMTILSYNSFNNSIYIYVAGQTAGPNRLKFVKEPYGGPRG